MRRSPSKEASPVQIERLWDTILAVPQRLRDSFVQEPHTHRPRTSALRMIDNWFLHVHPNRVSPVSLRPTTTLGLGLISLSLFVILAGTGLLLMVYYVPAVPEAYQRMQDLVYVVPAGRLIRDLHRLAAHGMVISVFLHLLRVFYTGAYKPPREFNWIVGIALATVTLALSFTGYLLPWDQLAFWAITVATGIANYYPVIGATAQSLLLGGPAVGQEALLRFYVLHVCALPVLAAGLIGYHVWRIRKDGGLAAQEVARRERRSQGNDGRRIHEGQEPPPAPMSAYPLLLWIEVAIGLAVLLAFVGLAILFPGRLDQIANPDHPPNPAKAPWYFVGLQELVSYSAVWGGVIVPVALLVGCLLLPYLDRDPRGVGAWFARERRAILIAGTLIVLAWLALTVVGAGLRGPNWNFYWPWEGWPGPG